MGLETEVDQVACHAGQTSLSISATVQRLSFIKQLINAVNGPIESWLFNL